MNDFPHSHCTMNNQTERLSLNLNVILHFIMAYDGSQNSVFFSNLWR